MNMEPNLMLIIIMGVCASILPMIAAYCYSNYIGKRVKTKEEREMTEEGGADAEQSYEELIKSYGQLPSAFMSFAPL